MKRKSIFFLFVIVFVFFGVWGFENVQTFFVDAASSDASVWDGEVDENVTSFDWYASGKEYYIRSAKGLLHFSSLVNAKNGYNSFSGATVHLEIDIDLNGNAWTPIGKAGQQFQGRFEGHGHYIFNLNINSYSECSAGFFGVLGENARIFDLHLRNVKIKLVENASILGANYVGCLAGKAETTTPLNAIQNCSAKGEIEVSAIQSQEDEKQFYVGGLVGEFANSNLSNVYTNVSLKVSGNAFTYAGGLVGKAKGINLSNSYAEGNVSLQRGCAGGLVGQIENISKIVNSYNAANLTAINNQQVRFGGLVGQANSNLSINHTYNAGDIVCNEVAGSYFGGLIGFLSDTGSLSNSFMVGELLNGSFVANEQISYLFNCSNSNIVTVKSVYFDNELSFVNLSNFARTRDFYFNEEYWTENWDVSNLGLNWAISIGINSGLPYLRSTYNLGNPNNDVSASSQNLKGEGTKTSPYLIETAGDLRLVSKLYETSCQEIFHFSLQNDIDLSGRAWAPIGFEQPFNGVFDGNGHTIKGMTCSLQTQFAYHGLFGQTKNAVIKNLLIDDVRFLNSGITQGAKGNLIGCVTGSTYVINCRDLSTENHTFGQVEKDLFVVYGRNNTSVGDILRENDIRWSEGVKDKVKIGLDVSISAEGGTFYDKNGDMYWGDFHVLVSLAENGKVSLLQPVYENGTSEVIIDESFGSKVFPTLSTNFKSTDIVVKRGFKLENFAYVKNNQILTTNEYEDGQKQFFIDNPAYAIYGLKALWTEGEKQKVKVIYNQYEKNNFNAEKENSPYIGRSLATGETIEMDDQGRVFVEYTLEYDSFVNESINNKIFQLPKYLRMEEIFSLRDGRFSIEGVYSDEQFENKQLPTESSFINENLSNLYVKWQGNETTTDTITVQFEGAKGIFDLQKAVKSIGLQQYVNENKQKLDSFTQLEESSDGQFSVTFNYNSLISDNKETYGNFNLELNPGFVLNQAVILSCDYADQNFGKLTTSRGLLSVESGVQVLGNEVSNFNDLKLLNLIGNYVIKLEIVRANYFNKILIGDDLLMGISPKINLTVEKNEDAGKTVYSSNVGIKNRGTGAFVDVLNFVNDEAVKQNLFEISEGISTTVNKDSLYVAFDLLNNRILFSGDTCVDSVFYAEFGNFNDGFDTEILYTTSDETGATKERRFSFEKKLATNEKGTQQQNIVIRELLSDSSAEKDLILTLILEENKFKELNFLSKASFVFVFSTENSNNSCNIENKLKVIEQEGYEGSITLTQIGTGVDKEKTKAVCVFDDVILKNAENVDSNSGFQFTALTTYTQAIFQVDFKQKDADGNLVDLQGLPPKVLALGNNGACDVHTKDGEVTFYIQNSDYYRILGTDVLAGTQAINLFAGINAENNFNLKLEVSYVNSQQSGVTNEGYTQRFNESNVNYLSCKEITLFQKGQMADLNADVLANDAYKIILSYSSFDTLEKGLQPGRYVATFVCEPVPYQIEVGTRFIDYVDLYPNDKLDLEQILTTELKTEQNNGISTDIQINGTVQTKSQIENVDYSDELNLTTALGTKQGYEFVRWLFVGENGKFLENGKALNFSFAELYGNEKNVLGSGERFKLSAYAVYVKKEVEIELSSNFLLKNFNGTDEDRFYNKASVLGLYFSLENLAENNRYVYSYSTETQPETLNVCMDGLNACGYYLCGFRLTDRYGSSVEIEKLTEDNEISDTKQFVVELELLKQKLENGEFGNLSQTLLLQPIIKQKTATLFLHSGTGDDSNLFGDGFNGVVKDKSGKVSTDVILQEQKLYFGQTRYLNQTAFADVNGQVLDTAENVFFSRTGYVKENINYWGWRVEDNQGRILYSQLNLNEALFQAVTGTNCEIHMFVNWTPQKYFLSFKANGGKFEEGEVTSIEEQIAFDEKPTNIPLNVMRAGYQFAGWKVAGQSEPIFDENGVFKSENDVLHNFSVDGRFQTAGSLELQAVWQSTSFDVLFDFNSGKTETGEVSKVETLQYAANFSTVLNANGTLKNCEISRAGYRFDGFFAIGDGVVQKINSNTIFDSSISSFSFQAEVDTPVLTLYARWIFDENFVSMQMQQTVLANLNYTGESQTVDLSQYLNENNVVVKNMTIVVSGDSVDIVLPEAMNTTVALELVSNSDAIVSGKSFSVLNAGYYSVTLLLTLKDEAEHLNLGNVLVLKFNLSISVNLAEISISDVFNDLYYVQNARRLIVPFVDNTTAEKMNNALSLQELVNQFKELEGVENFVKPDGSDPTNLEVYQYILVKYYLLTCTNNGNDAKTYKNWRFEDFLAYEASEGNLVSAILNNLKFFTYYDHNNSNQTLALVEYANTLSLISETVKNHNLSINRLQVVSFAGQNFQANNSYEIRVYLNASENNENFNVNYDGSEAYIVAGRAFFLPEIFKLRNFSKEDSAYYSSNISNRQVIWADESEGLEIYSDGRKFYEVEEGIFVSARLMTSAAGRADAQTEFSFANQENFLYFDRVTVLRKLNATYSDITSNFKLTLDERDLFTILSTDGIARISVSGKYLTTRGGAIYFEKLAETDAILSIAEVRYNFDGKEKISTAENGLPQSSGVFTEGDGTVIFQVEANNSTEVSLFVNSTVTRVTFATSKMRIKTYAGLYKWSEGNSYEIDGKMTTQDSLTVTKEEIDLKKNENGLTKIDYNAVYTDLVRVNLDLNLPEGYETTSATSSTLKLGESTREDLIWPYEPGFGTCVSLKYIKAGQQLDLSELFSGPSGTFVGISESNQFQPVQLAAKWSVKAEIDCEQILTTYKTAVSAFERLSVNDIVNFNALNEAMFDYTFEWFKFDENTSTFTSISTQREMQLLERGSANESGRYKLAISANLKEIFLDALEDPSQSRGTKELTFELDFVKHKVESVNVVSKLNENAFELIFDNQEHRTDWKLQLSYRVYDRAIDDFGEIQTREFGFGSNNLVEFEINLQDDIVSEMKNVGFYTVKVKFDESKLNLATVGNKFDFNFEIAVRDVDLSLFNFDATKVFNSMDPMLDKQIYVNDNGLIIESLNVLLTRKSGEDLGEYDIIFAGLSDEKAKQNYRFKVGEIVVFENGHLTENASNTKLGTFTITSSGALRLSYIESEEQPAVFAQSFDEAGFTVVLTNDFKLQIKNKGITVKQFDLQLFDVSNGLKIESQEILEILKRNNDLTAKFFNGQLLSGALNAGVYNYQFAVGESFKNYYSAVEISQEFQFEIQPKQIDPTTITFAKIYDGETVVHVDLEGAIINDKENFEGLYLTATFASAHAGENIRVDLKLESNTEVLSNYVLTQAFAYGEIHKRKASTTFAFKDGITSFEYGNISVTNVQTLGDLILMGQLQDENGNVLPENLLVPGFFEINFELNADATHNANGFLYKGHYTLTANCNFYDFEMTCNALNFEVTTKFVTKQVQPVTITVLDSVKATYQEKLTIAETGEELTLNYKVVDLEGNPVLEGQRLPEGQYDFVLVNDYYSNDSIVVTIEKNNNALNVVSASSTIYVRIENKTELKKTYNGKSFEIETVFDALSSKIKFTISSQGETSSTATELSFFTVNETTGEKTVVDGANLANKLTVLLNDMEQASAVGTYRLTLNLAEGSPYSFVVFDEEYAFEISPIKIDANLLDLNKAYDMQTTKTINNFAGKIAAEDVSIFVKYEDANVGKNKPVSIFLQGSDMKNYEIVNANEAKGEISKALAEISIDDNNFVYGDISLLNEFKLSVNTAISILPTTQYVLSIQVENAEYSSAGFLNAGNYILKVSGTSENYEIADFTTSITVLPYDISIIFRNDGEVTAEFGTAATQSDTFVFLYNSNQHSEKFEVSLTRASGSEMGFYKILSGVSNDKNYHITNVRDVSAQGAYRIVKPSNTVYVLFADGSISQSIIYDGSEFNSVSLEVKNNSAMLVLSNLYDSSIQSLKLELGFYRLVGDEYVKAENLEISGLVSILRFANFNSIKNEGTYQIYASGTTSETHSVKLGKDGLWYSFEIVIQKSKLQLKTNQIQRSFTNKDAIFMFDDAAELFNGVIAGDDLKAEVKFIKLDGNIAKYVGEYGVQVSLSGANANNYALPDLADVLGIITQAKVVFEINTHNFTYGQKIEIKYNFTTEIADFNLEDYLNAGREWRVSTRIVGQEENLSTTGNLKVGQYNISLSLISDDFSPSSFIVDNQEQLRLDVKLNVTKKKLTLKETRFLLENIFTKPYDETDVANIIKDGELMFEIVGIVNKDGISDDVTIAKANFETANIGQMLDVRFTLSGSDCENYSLADYANGVIQPVVINLSFAYDRAAGIVSDVTQNGLKELSKLAYPFNAQNYLTSNSLSTETQSVDNFPTTLLNNDGQNFAYWSLNFEANAAQKLALDALISSIGLQNKGSGDLYKIVVGNDAKTVKFIKSLLEDSRDLFGLYYRNENVTLVFEPNWQVVQCNIKVEIADEKGNKSNLGTFTVGENEAAVTDFAGEVAFGDSFVLKATANERCFYFGTYFYDSNGQAISTTNNEQIAIDENGNIILAIKSVEKDYHIVIRFEVQKINLIVDLSKYDDATLLSSAFESLGGGKYRWATDFFTIEKLNFTSLPNISMTGFGLTGFKVNETVVAMSDFETTKISSFLENVTNKTYDLVLEPVFAAAKVAVTLDFGFDDIQKKLTIDFGEKYNSVSEWEENPTRIGYDFLGWFNGNKKVLGSETVSTTSPHLLLAKWQIQKFDVTIRSPFADITSANPAFEKNENTYVLKAAQFNQKISFVVKPHQGYQLLPTWGENLTIVNNADGTANVSFVMPATAVNFEIPVSALSNVVTIFGENLSEIVAENLTDDMTLEVSNNSIVIETGKKLQIKVAAALGYHMLSQVVFSNEDGLSTLAELDKDGLLVLTIEGIAQDLSITFKTEESLNEITLKFENNQSVSELKVGEKTFNNFDNLPSFEVLTNHSLTFFVKFKHGYKFGDWFAESFSDADEISLETELLTEGENAGWFKFIFSGASSNGSLTIISIFEKFTITMKSISWDDNNNEVEVSDNRPLVNGESSAQLDYLSTATLTYTCAPSYKFQGWSYDGKTIFSSLAELAYEVTQDEIIYAIFSMSDYFVSLGTVNAYKLYAEYNDPTLTQNKFDEIEAQYFDENGNQILEFQMSYGVDKVISFVAPKGFYYAGYGYFNNSKQFVYLNREVITDERVDVSISSEEFAKASIYKLYMVVNAYSTIFNVHSDLDFDGKIEENTHVGKIELVASDGTSANEFGYVDGTRVHYNAKTVDGRNFAVTAYSLEDVYLKISTSIVGYRFDRVEIKGFQLQPEKIEAEDYVIYKFSGFLGAQNSLIDFQVFYKPILNVIQLNFKNKGILVDGGAFEIAVEDENKNKVWSSGSEYSTLKVSAYTDSSFIVTAYVKAGYYLDFNQISFLEGAEFVDEKSVECRSLSVSETGYTCKVRFKVCNFLGTNEISLELLASTYTVALKDDDQVLAYVKNVEFNSFLDLTQVNADNIEIVSEKVHFVNGKLKIEFSKDKHNYEGYFTYPNGVGVQYINSSSDVVRTWQENGYVFNNLTKRFELANNAEINQQGDMEISLYLYMSYRKTRISIEIVPQIYTNLTAKDIITGVDDSNSWFYNSEPMIMEISFNTSVFFTAPQIEGYKFYKFVISQKLVDRTWVSDAISFSERVPWSTNEFDNFVECKVQIIYFAEVEVRVLGGEGTYKISQETNDSQALVLLSQGFVDTSKAFTIEATAGEGYSFLRWNNMSTGDTTFSKTYSTKVSRKVILIMNLKGLEVELNFEKYDALHGQIVRADVVSMDNSRQSYLLGRYVGGSFEKVVNKINVNVGDVVTFNLKIDFGFAVQWNRSDIQFGTFKSDQYTFTLKIGNDLALSKVDIIPTFKDEILSVFVSANFAKEENLPDMIDGNNVNFAGSLTDKSGNKLKFMTINHGYDIVIFSKTNIRYEIENIIISNYDKVFEGVEKFLTEDERIVLTNAFLEENEIVGTINIEVIYSRKYWEENLLKIDSFVGSGTTKDPYQISSLEDLILMMKLCNGGNFNEKGVRFRDCAYVLTTDIDLSEKFWTPIGNLNFVFNGQFNFNGHKVDGIFTAKLYDPVSYNGLFGRLGHNAEIFSRIDLTWVIYVSVGIGTFVVIMLGIFVWINLKRKKRQREMAKK